MRVNDEETTESGGKIHSNTLFQFIHQAFEHRWYLISVLKYCLWHKEGSKMPHPFIFFCKILTTSNYGEPSSFYQRCLLIVTCQLFHFLVTQAKYIHLFTYHQYCQKLQWAKTLSEPLYVELLLLKSWHLCINSSRCRIKCMLQFLESFFQKTLSLNRLIKLFCHNMNHKVI